MLLAVQAGHVEAKSEILKLWKGRHDSQIVNLNIVWLGLSHSHLLLVEAERCNEAILSDGDEADI